MSKKLAICFLCFTLVFSLMLDVANAKIITAQGEQEYTATKYLDNIRLYTPELIIFMNQFPKGADLHNHLSGAYFAEEMLVLGARQGYMYDLSEQQVLPPNTKKNAKIISVAELLNRPDDLKKYLDAVSMRGFYKNTVHGSDHFFATFDYIAYALDGPESLARVIARNHSQHVYYVEFMRDVVPQELYAKVRELLPQKEFTVSKLADAYKKIQPYLKSEEFVKAVNVAMSAQLRATDKILREKYNLTILGEHPDIIVKFIPHLYRHQSNYELFIRSATSLSATQIHKDIVAVNLVQCEAHPLAMKNFDAQMEILDFLYNNMNKPNILLHAGELNLRDSSLEAMRERISKSITKGHALRIGHGVSIAWENNPYATLNLMKERGIPIEICLSSNDVILGVVGADHPLKLYLEAGVPVTLNTDDEGVARSNLSQEYVRAAQEHNLSYATFKEIARNALEYSLLAGESIFEPRNAKFEQEYKIKSKYEDYIFGKFATSKLNIKELGEKAYFQIKHERDLDLFEKSLNSKKVKTEFR